MKIDLNDKPTRILIQEYVNKIYNCGYEQETNYTLYKLIHTFDVLRTAKDLIKQTKPAPSKTMQKHILDAALLHDIGRCYEYKNGKHQKIDHGKVGADLIKKYLPQMKLEQTTTLLHNKMPSENDPLEVRPVLNYVRDADMLANIRYQTDYTDAWLNHLLWSVSKDKLGSQIDTEIKKAAQNHTQVNAQKVQKRTFLNMVLGQLCWYHGLKTQAAIKIAKQRKLFIHFRTAICEKVLPRLELSPKIQQNLAKEIEEIFPDTLFSQ